MKINELEWSNRTLSRVVCLPGVGVWTEAICTECEQYLLLENEYKVFAVWMPRKDDPEVLTFISKKLSLRANRSYELVFAVTKDKVEWLKLRCRDHYIGRIIKKEEEKSKAIGRMLIQIRDAISECEVEKYEMYGAVIRESITWHDHMRKIERDRKREDHG